MEVKNGIVHLSLNKNKVLEHLIDCVTLTYSNLVGEKYKVTIIIIVVTSDFVWNMYDGYVLLFDSIIQSKY